MQLYRHAAVSIQVVVEILFINTTLAAIFRILEAPEGGVQHAGRPVLAQKLYLKVK